MADTLRITCRTQSTPKHSCRRFVRLLGVVDRMSGTLALALPLRSRIPPIELAALTVARRNRAAQFPSGQNGGSSSSSIVSTSLGFAATLAALPLAALGALVFTRIQSTVSPLKSHSLGKIVIFFPSQSSVSSP